MPKLKLDDNGRPIPQILNEAGTEFIAWKGDNYAGRVTGDVAHGQTDDGKPIKIGGRAVDLSSLPAEVSAGQRVNAIFDRNGRILARIDIAPPLSPGAATAAKQDEIIQKIQQAQQTMYVNRGIVNMGKAIPLYHFAFVSVPGDTLLPAEFQAVSIPQGKAWLIATATGQTTTNGNIQNLILDGVGVGFWVPPNTYVEKFLKQWYGDYILVTNSVKILAINTGASAENQALSLYGWEITL